ncbi:MAG: hypothetical protein ACRCUS_04260, partial [Anaerovoracaceae bacterium]
VLGAFIKFDTTGVDFAMTALFVVIMVEQWLSNKSHLPAYIGMAAGILCLLILGPEKFLMPAMIATVGILLLVKKPYTKILEKNETFEKEENITTEKIVNIKSEESKGDNNDN